MEVNNISLGKILQCQFCRNLRHRNNSDLPKYINYIFFSPLQSFCYVGERIPYSNCAIRRCFEDLLENRVHSKKKKYYAVTTFQTTHYIKRERLKQEAALPKELLENTEASHMPIWDVQGVAVL